MADSKTILSGAEEKMDMAIMYLEDALAHIRAGKADVRLLDGIRVDSYGSMAPGSRRFRILARTLSGACCVSSVRMLHPIGVYPNCRTAFAIVGLVTPNGGRNKLTGCEVTRSSSH